jgi:methyl-accepting chemotaxis protein
MPENSMMNAQERKIFEDMNKNLSSVVSNLKDLNAHVKNLNNQTNSNNLMWKVVESVKEVGKQIKDSVDKALKSMPKKTK